MDTFTGKTAVITGGGSGIGRSMALALAAEGTNVVVADIELAAAESVAAELVALGVEVIGLQADVSKLESVTALADAAYARFGSVEILCNNAGVTLRPFRASWDTSYEDYQWLFSVNFWGVLNGHHVFVPRMRETAGRKHIVNTSSVTSLAPMAGHAAYIATKGAIDGFSKVAREELATQDIGLSLLHPGAVRTHLVESERLRDEADRSATRGVTPWADYVTDGGSNPLAGGSATAGPSIFTYIEPDDIGRLVVAGIRNNTKHILTHPAPTLALLDEVREIVAGDPANA